MKRNKELNIEHLTVVNFKNPRERDNAEKL